MQVTPWTPQQDFMGMISELLSVYFPSELREATLHIAFIKSLYLA